MEEKLDFQIYDDRDFYHSLVREFLSAANDFTTSKVEENDTSMALTQEYFRKREKLNSRNRNKAKKTNKISKDRKLKYIIHDKLINFMAPKDEELLQHGREDILEILFGCSVEKSKQPTTEEKDTKNVYKRQKVKEEEDLGIELI